MMRVSQIIMLCLLNLYSAVCQLYLDKTGRRKKEKPDKFDSSIREHQQEDAKQMHLWFIALSFADIAFFFKQIEVCDNPALSDNG